ncbi:hypothetical protein BCR32DRAFT_276845 [Anaeromyces robustus]|uniref:60S ribosomal protein L41 n=1 Tax=Anaeromyces robustus TaxID=1754192 RepID=A0A1Y1XGB1_9FUNG|nr:hypothetical protein BCR32DRAFT_276845 [Anaeromyces robustus]|eukprot:ORX84753.1 hypothetical protein BCR32DRAFT_276845 [Anaeromyces robustus]
MRDKWRKKRQRRLKRKRRKMRARSKKSVINGLLNAYGKHFVILSFLKQKQNEYLINVLY